MQDILPKSKDKPISSTNPNQAIETALSDNMKDAFKTPEQIVEEESSTRSSEPNIMPETPLTHAKKHSFFRLRLDKNELPFFVIGVVFLLASVLGIYFITNRTDSLHFVTSTHSSTPTKVTETPKIYSNLTGLEITDKTINDQPVTAVMIENSKEARPQAGLVDAGIVFEAIAEGGITRFVALYQDTTPSYVGPIRSARPYYLDFILPFKASLAHVGGSPEALNDIKTLGITDLDEFYNGSSYTRITSRYAPHNTYTSLDKLNSLEKAKGDTDADFASFSRKDDTPAVTPDATNIIVAISGGIYNSSYVYSKDINSYLRSQGGAAHIDETTKRQISPKAIVVMEMSRGISSDGEHTKYQTVGSGKVTIFQDGTATKGTWSKDARSAVLTLKDDTGKNISLNRGQTWFVAVDSLATNLSYGL